MFRAEANGLAELRKAQAIRVPEVILLGDDFLLLQAIQTGHKGPLFYHAFGHALAKLHQHTATSFGFFQDNYIGATPQYNIAQGRQATSWVEFYFCKRLLPQLHFAEKNGCATDRLRKGMSLLENKIEKILDGSQEPPSALHGDLWSGNYLCDAHGEPVLIDPAFYYGHREADLAMTKMFGGFTAAFYAAYQQANPMLTGWQYRENLYLLYHYFNHLNLFGSGYYAQTEQLLWTYLK